MCGISGIISLNQKKIDYSLLAQMTKKMEKRGPDGEGFLITNNNEFAASFNTGNTSSSMVQLQHAQNIGLGHRRLSITDLSPAAAQPMCDVSKRYWIVFNGQIYNHGPLRLKLEQLGHTFKTHHSDTEVILNAYSQWGINCLQEFDGTWSFCLWDSLENTVFIARDRMGVRPVYYTAYNGMFYFASEMNALITDKNVSRELDHRGIYDYLTYTHVPSPGTIFRDIKKLPAAHYLFFKPGERLSAVRYWSPIVTEPLLNLSEKEIISMIREKIYNAVHTRMQADVQVGMLLSGGLDSSINLACMSKFSPGPVKTYTVGFENKNQYRNEFDHARKVSALFKADYHELLVSEKDFFNFLPHLAYLQDEPIADPAITAIYFISKLASEDNVKVLLGGEGSDELFIGYQHWRLIYEFEKVFRDKPLLAGAFAYLHKKSVFRNKRPHYQAWSYKLSKKWPTFWGGTEIRTEADKHKILSPDFLNKIGYYNSFEPLNDLFSELTAKKPYETFEWMTINDLQHRLPDQLLARLDRMMMAASIEGRHPFLDSNIIEFVLRIPQPLKVRQRTEKYLLKKAFENILPNEIIYRSKDSFSVPMNELFRDTKRKKEYLDVITTFNHHTGIFQKPYIKQLESPARLKEFWNVLNLALWHQGRR